MTTPSCRSTTSRRCIKLFRRNDHDLWIVWRVVVLFCLSVVCCARYSQLLRYYIGHCLLPWIYMTAPVNKSPTARIIVTRLDPHDVDVAGTAILDRVVSRETRGSWRHMERYLDIIKFPQFRYRLPSSK